jgi:hypothetical protein
VFNGFIISTDSCSACANDDEVVHKLPPKSQKLNIYM